ncbi:MAG: hypothetical protein JST82_01495 [Bacteroidetes bacterium]|nr:hypothetical protein [Bacteroidota bacterium]
MKNRHLLVAIFLLSGCTSNVQNTKQHIQLQCSTANDATLLGYKGNIKSVIEKQLYQKDSLGTPVSDLSTAIYTVIHFDSAGLITYHKRSTSENMQDADEWTYDHKNGSTTAIHTVDNGKTFRLKDHLSARTWNDINVYTEVTQSIYDYNGRDTTLTDRTRIYTLNNDCLPVSTKRRDITPTETDTSTVYTTYSSNGDTTTIYYFSPNGEKQINNRIITISRDTKGNPLKKMLYFKIIRLTIMK